MHLPVLEMPSLAAGAASLCRAVSLVFVLEKLFYVYTWVHFLRTGDLSAVGDPVAWLFLSAYGLWDLLCAIAVFLPAALC